MAERVTVLDVGRELTGGERELLASADLVIATRAELAAVRGLVPAHAVVDVLGDTALDDPEGHHWNLPVEPDDVVVLAPTADLARRIAMVIDA